MGRREIPLDPAKVEALAAQGLNGRQIARSLGIHYSTLCVRKNKYAAFNDAIENGRAKGIAKVTNSLFQKAGEGDTVAMIFYLKNRDPKNWLEAERQASEAAQAPVVNLTIEQAE